MAPIVVKKLAGVAAPAMLAVLAGSMVADLAVGDRRVVLGGALAAIVDWRVDHQPGQLAGKWLGAPPFEQPDPGRCQVGRARLDTVVVQQVPTIATDPAGVARREPGAEVAVLVQAPAAQVDERPGLNPATFAGQLADAFAPDEQTVTIAAGALDARRPFNAGAPTVLGLAAVPWTCRIGGGRAVGGRGRCWRGHGRLGGGR